MSNYFPNIPTLLDYSKEVILKDTSEVSAGRWQGTDQFKDQPMLEQINFGFSVPIPQTKEQLQLETRCNMPWAEEHFQERISGVPMNPGVSYLSWPFNTFKKGQDDPFLKKGKFSHTYMERFWPKNAGTDLTINYKVRENRGIHYAYGDLWDVINLLIENPYTRQAYLPIFFPEDTGATHGERIPCTLGYLFLYRGGLMHITYYIRSCDFYRHFRNDIYLAGRLVQYVAKRVSDKNPDVNPTVGILTMHIGSFHLFKNDIYLIKKGNY